MRFTLQGLLEFCTKLHLLIANMISSRHSSCRARTVVANPTFILLLQARLKALYSSHLTSDKVFRLGSSSLNKGLSFTSSHLPLVLKMHQSQVLDCATWPSSHDSISSDIAAALSVELTHPRGLVAQAELCVCSSQECSYTLLKCTSHVTCLNCKPLNKLMTIHAPCQTRRGLCIRYRH